jgi:hypothetical protein
MDPPIRLVLDTSVFTNPDSARSWGDDVESALGAFVQAARAAGRRGACYMPPSVLEELKTFVSSGSIPADFELVVRLQAPNRYQVAVPGFLLYELIDDIRNRIDRGLRVAERAVREAGPDNVERSVARLRNKYREALRSGLLDSREDVDIILLARELDAALVSSDRAVVTWAEKLGIRLVHPDNLREILQRMAADE